MVPPFGVRFGAFEQKSHGKHKTASLAYKKCGLGIHCMALSIVGVNRANGISKGKYQQGAVLSRLQIPIWS